MYNFLCSANQRVVVKQAYNMSQKMNMDLGYLYFKEAIPKAMERWQYRDEETQTMEALEFLNKKFLRDNKDLFMIPNCDTNVYKSSEVLTHITVEEDGKIVKNQQVKKPKDIYALDMHLLDVWSQQTTDIVNAYNRYGNQIPVWQRSMNTRHYDRSNQGFHDADPYHASLDNQIHGYSEMQNLQKLIQRRRR
jgi:hypothetical protein